MHDGGLLAKDNSKIYYLGIIDVLTFYGVMKKVEYTFKKVRFGDQASCIPPKPYGERFVNFMKKAFD